MQYPTIQMNPASFRPSEFNGQNFRFILTQGEKAFDYRVDTQKQKFEGPSYFSNLDKRGFIKKQKNIGPFLSFCQKIGPFVKTN